MARKKPISGKARRIKLLTSRAAKQPVITPHPADVVDPTLARLPAAPPELPATSSRPSGIARHRTAEDSERQSRKDVQLRLESRFLRLPLDLLNHHRLVAATEALNRPIPPQLGYCLTQDLQPEALKGLTCPKRPKWNYAMSKLEVEKNEEGVFKKWLASTDETLSTFASSLPSTPAPSFYERNLQVWRQLWRVTEASDILLVLVDVRFPLIHYPPSLEEFCRTLKKKQKVIIVLTKTDLVPTWLSEGWKAWFEEREGPDGADVVLMESYKEIERHALTQGTQARYIPSAPNSCRNSLVAALKKAHSQLLQPPPAVADFPDRLARWSPNLRVNVDWDSIENPDAEPEAGSSVPPAKEKKVRRNKAKDAYVPRRKRPNPGDIDEPTVEEEVVVEEEEVQKPVEQLKGDAAHPFLSVGLIGQPNVGKSSLLNALLQRKVVRASRTPGKTKSLQTIFWNANLRLVDCPGLVCPSFAGMERQVLSGILPIQNVEPVLYFISQRLPLERILKLHHPDPDVKEEDQFWTCDDILNSLAELNNYKTAKAGRNDLYRAGSVILRQMHNSAIPWAFRPPSNSPTIPRPKEGIFIPAFTPRATSATAAAVKREMEQEEEDSNSDDEDEEEDEGEQSESGSEEEEEDDPAAVGMFSAIRSAFAGLEVESGGSDEEESDDEKS